MMEVQLPPRIRLLLNADEKIGVSSPSVELPSNNLNVYLLDEDSTRIFEKYPLTTISSHP
jgi:hypothetical protein